MSRKVFVVDFWNVVNSVKDKLLEFWNIFKLFLYMKGFKLNSDIVLLDNGNVISNRFYMV